MYGLYLFYVKLQNQNFRATQIPYRSIELRLEVIHS